MKHRLNAILLAVLIFVTFALASCDKKHSATGEFINVTTTATTITVEAKIRDSEDEVKSPFLRLLESDGTRVKKIDLSDIPGQDDDGEWKTETEKMSGLTMDTAYTLELVCTISSDEVVLASEEVSTNKSGTSEEEPNEIDSETKLYQMINDLNACYKLTADIELNPEVAKSAIFNSSKIFNGTFDGNGHTISGFYETESVQYSGIFGYVGPEATVKNLTLSNFNIKISRTSASSVGALAGYCAGDIDNVKVVDSKIDFTTTSTTNTAYIGGLVGEATGTIKNSSTENVTITESAKNIAFVGGFVGNYSSNSENKIENCEANSNITVNQASTSTSTSSTVNVIQCVGGFVADNNGYIQSCAATGSITSTYSFNTAAKVNEARGVELGGFAGATSRLSSLKNVVANTDISFTSNVSYHTILGLVIGYADSHAIQNSTNLIYNGTNKTVAIELCDNEETTEALDEKRHIYFGVIGYAYHATGESGSETIEESSVIAPTYKVSKFVNTADIKSGKLFSELEGTTEYIKAYVA